MAMVVKITLTGMAPYFELWDEDSFSPGKATESWMKRTMVESTEIVAYYPGAEMTAEMMNTAVEEYRIMGRKKCSR